MFKSKKVPLKWTFAMNSVAMYNFYLNWKVEEILKHTYEPANLICSTQITNYNL